MPYLIDGHNLIPKVGLRLDSTDDELELIELLQVHSRRSRSQMEVYFDGAPPGMSGSRKFGRITAIFVSQTSTADAAISQRLAKLSGDARNWTVVSSDRQVLQAARAAHARTQRAEEFASQVRMDGARPSDPAKATPARDDGGGMSDAEIERWLEAFKRRG